MISEEQELNSTKFTLTVLLLAVAALQPLWADYEVGQRAWDAGQVGEKVELWEEAALAEDKRAVLELGQLHFRGLGMLQD